MFSGPCELNDLRQIIDGLTRYMCIEIAASACFKLNLNLQSQWNIGWLPRQNICLTISSYTEFFFYLHWTYSCNTDIMYHNYTVSARKVVQLGCLSWPPVAPPGLQYTGGNLAVCEHFPASQTCFHLLHSQLCSSLITITIYTPSPLQFQKF